MQDAIIVKNLGKRFNKYHAHKPVTIMEAALSGFRLLKPKKQFWALRQVSLTVGRGEMLGIIGHNGAGKSTLLNLLGGITAPTEGNIQIRGRIGGLLDLGAGMHGDMTGRENVYVTAIIAGLTRQEVQQCFNAIVEFAELQKFIDNPVRTYSTGMTMRLAFSIAVHSNPEILLVDEFLSVGDLSFQAKCLDRIKHMQKQGCAIVLVSHDTQSIERLCDRALMLRHGRIIAYEDPSVVAEQYSNEMKKKTQDDTPEAQETQLLATRREQELKVNQNRFGSLEIEIVDVRLVPHSQLKSGDSLCIEIDYKPNQPIEKALFGVVISHENGEIVLDISTPDASSIQAQHTVKLDIDRLDLCGGTYFVDVGIYEQNWAYTYDYHWRIYFFKIDAAPNSKGFLCPPMRWSLH